VWPEIFDIAASADERTFLARPKSASFGGGRRLGRTQVRRRRPDYADCGFPTGEYADAIARFLFYGDLERKGLVRAEHHTMGSPNTYRATYLSAVLISEADPRHGGARAGLISWSVSVGVDAHRRCLDVHLCTRM
jgi:hypothetical protein